MHVAALIKNGNAMLTSSAVMTSVKKSAAAVPAAKQFVRGFVMLGFCALGSAASADTIFGLHGSAHLWQPELGGTIGQNTNAFDFSSSFSGGEGDSTSLLAAVEHPIPLLPNLQLRNTCLLYTSPSPRDS